MLFLSSLTAKRLEEWKRHTGCVAFSPDFDGLTLSPRTESEVEAYHLLLVFRRWMAGLVLCAPPRSVRHHNGCGPAMLRSVHEGVEQEETGSDGKWRNEIRV